MRTFQESLRIVLNQVHRDRLLVFCERLNIRVAARRSKLPIIDSLIAAAPAQLKAILDNLARTELNAACKKLGVDHTGVHNGPIVRRLLEHLDAAQTVPPEDISEERRVRGLFALPVNPPRAFISYSHDSESHRDWVLKQAYALRERGVDAILDRFSTAPPQGWPKWMADEVSKADFILSVCTPTYRRRFEGHEELGKGLGATLEGLLATQLLYEANMRNHKIVPILFHGEPMSAVPIVLRPYTRYVLPDQMDDLLRHLLGEPEIVAPPVKRRGVQSGGVLPPMNVQSEGSGTSPSASKDGKKSIVSTKPTPTVEVIKTKKLKLAAKALFVAAQTAEDSDWKSINGWHAEWRPWFTENLTPGEVLRILNAVKKPPEPEVAVVSRRPYRIVRLNDPCGDAVAALQAVLTGLVNKYAP